MSEIVFTLALPSQSGQALYLSNQAVADPSKQSALCYFAFLADQTAAPPTISGLAECFDTNSAVYRGAFVFVDNAVLSDGKLEDQFARDLFAMLAEKLVNISNPLVNSRLAWTEGSAFKSKIDVDAANSIQSNPQLPFGRWIIEIGSTSTIAVSGDDGLIINPDGTGVNILVEDQGSISNIGSKPSSIDLALTGAHVGALKFRWDWGHEGLQIQFGGELRMFYGSDAENAHIIRYPMFLPPQSTGPISPIDLAFQVTAHPVAQLDGARTRLALSDTADPDTFNTLQPVLMRTPTGSQVKLSPIMSGTTVDGAGFGFAKTSAGGQTDLYLAPVGHFTIEKVTEETVSIMAGTAGSEFFFTEPGDTLVLENNRPAFAKNFEPGSTKQQALEDDLTTSWSFVQKKVKPQAAEPGEITTSYCAQPPQATYFGARSTHQPDDYLVAVGISLSELGKLPDGNDPFVPFMPYGGLYQLEETGDDSPIVNPKLPASTAGDFERLIIEPARRETLEKTFDTKHGPVFFDASQAKAFDGGSVRTPMGFVADLNSTGNAPGAPIGTAKSLKFAQSPQNPDQFLSLFADAISGVVSPTFMNTAMHNDLFMVVTRPSLLWPTASTTIDGDTLGNEIQLGDFTFKLNVGAVENPYDEKHPNALVVFKYLKGVSFKELYAQTSRWEKTSFLAEDDCVKKVKEKIGEYIADAANNTDGLYDNFNTIINDPDWSGILVFNCPLDYQALPADLQILLGGIDGTLRAHHFGVTINQVKVGDTPADLMSIKSSSLFAVIDYNKELKKPSKYPAFQVLKLNVEYANSKLVVFNSRIAFSLDHLYGNPVDLTSNVKGDNNDTKTIEIDGFYTLHEDGTGSLVFSTSEQRVFSFPVDDDNVRIAQAQTVDNAALVPISSVKQTNGDVLATASFQLDGTLALADDIGGGDLFSFGEITDGVPQKGVAVVNYAFTIPTTIPPEEGPGKLHCIAEDLSGAKVDQGLSDAREGSFEQGFPCQITSINFVKGGLDTSAVGAWPVHFETDGDWEAQNPVYMLGFKLSLGSLGGLVSSVSNITTDLYVGWVPGGTKDQSDKVGVILQLPPVVSGPDGFKVQGIAPSSFESVYIDYQDLGAVKTGGDRVYAYDLRFQHYSDKLLNLPLFYDTGPADLGIFGSPDDPGSDNPLWFVGESEDSDWSKGNSLDAKIFLELPIIFIGRSYAIETEPTDPDVIEDAIDELNPLREMSVSEYMKKIYQNSDKYSSAAGMTFALKFEFLALSFAALFHDNDFYGAKVALEFSEDDDEKKKEGGDGDGSEGGDGGGGEEDDKKKKGVNKLSGLEFSILYRKISEDIGVWSATIFIDIGEIEIGAGSLTLPDFTISIWTNGDWRFSVGWPLDNHPIVVQFQAGPIPVIGKLGFYLAKLSSEASPKNFLVPPTPPATELEYPPNFKIIWSFGLGISAGVGREFEKGPFSASASVSLVLTCEGTLGSFQGNFSKDGVDYYWICISLAIVGELEGAVDFKIISVEISITLTAKISLAIETLHKTHLVLTVQVTVRASIKIIFFKIHFSFDLKLTLLDTSFGSGKYDASLSGANPAEVADQLPHATPAPTLDELMSEPELMPLALNNLLSKDHRQLPLGVFDPAHASHDMLQELAAAGKTTIDLSFALQSTAIYDGTTCTPQAVATLVIETGGLSSPFGQLSQGIADWLLASYGGSGGIDQQLANIAAALKAGAFDDKVEACLGSQFSFNVSALQKPTGDDVPSVAAFPVHPTMGCSYNGQSKIFGADKVPSNYADLVEQYFNRQANAVTALAAGDESVASIVFDEFFRMFAKQLVAEMQDQTGNDIASRLTEDVLSDLGGFVSRFLLGGLRLPDPTKKSVIKGLYTLTSQQFPIITAPTAILSAELVGADLPSWISLTGGKVAAALESDQVYDTAPKAHPWTIAATNPISEIAATFPMNVSLSWEQRSGPDKAIFNFADSLHLAIEKWRGDNPSAANGPWLRLEQVTGTSTETKKSADFDATGALVLPLKIKTIQSADGATNLANVYSLVGTDEVHRAYLQAMLDDPNLDLSSLDVSVTTNESQGKYKSSAAPKVLVRTNLSTNTTPGGGAAAVAMAAVEADEGNDYCANYAKPGEGGEELAKFLRLIWECSIVHTGGFYLQMDGLDQSKFINNELSLQLIVTTGVSAGTIEAEPYHNALIGDRPKDGYAVVANLDDNDSGKPVVNWTASYAGGNASWSIDWKDPDLDPSVTGNKADILCWLYQMVSYRVTKFDGALFTKPELKHWSRPVTATTEDGQWQYQKSFATAPFAEATDPYAAVGKDIDIEISIEDLFGNSMPLQALPMAIVYNDDLLGLGHWMSTQTNFSVADSQTAGKVDLNINFTYGSQLFSLGDFANLKALMATMQAHSDPVPSYLWTKIGEANQKVLSDSEAKPLALQKALIDGLNTAISSSALYDAHVFDGVNLSAQVKALLAENPTGPLLVFLNRLLLCDAFSKDIALQIGDKTDQQALASALAEYQKIANQLRGPKVYGAINTNGLLAVDTPADSPETNGTYTPPAGSLCDAKIISSLIDYVGSITTWLEWLIGDNSGASAPDIPMPMSISFELDKSYPTNWSGDLRELEVSLLIKRGGVSDTISDLAPLVRSVSSPITPAQTKSTANDPTGLAIFAENFELAYAGFDGTSDGVLKVATGVNSDLKSKRLGKQTLWLSRWGATSGITINVINDDDHEPVYYATPPLSTQLITRKVKDLVKYDGGTATSVPEQTFSSIDIDKWAETFLSSVEGIFTPELAPNVANMSSDSGDGQIYDPFVQSKTNLARAIADKLAYIYANITEEDSDKAGAIETMRQALLQTLENDYGIAALVQMAVQVGLHGEIAPDATAPNIYGNIMPVPDKGQIADNPLPFTLSPSKIALKEGPAWLNFLLAVEDPSAQKALTLELAYQMGFIEHDIDPDASKCGYTPSDWLTFVLQQDPQGLTPSDKNTLTAQMGNPRIPIPLRSYPPLPKLIAATAKWYDPTNSGQPPQSIEEAMKWSYGLTVEMPSAFQDTLVLEIALNEPINADSLHSKTSTLIDDLFDALARYIYAYPSLKPAIESAATAPSAEAAEALKRFRDLTNEVASLWPSWKQPNLKQSLNPLGESDKSWIYRIDRGQDGSLIMSLPANGDDGREDDDPVLPPWPKIGGYNYPPQKTDDGWVYSLETGSEMPPQVTMTWEPIYILTYQSARASAHIERHSNLGKEVHKETNSEFVYRTESVRMPSASVPLVNASAKIGIPAGDKLETAVQAMFDAMRNASGQGLGATGDQPELKTEGPISYTFELLSNQGSSVDSFLPLYLMEEDIAAGSDSKSAAKVVEANIRKWFDATAPSTTNSSLSFRVTVFATKIVKGDEQLPLVQFHEINIPAKSNDDWW